MLAYLNRLLILSLLFVGIALPTRSRTVHPAVKANLDLLGRLDTIVANHSQYIERKENKIALLRQNMIHAKSLPEKLGMASQLYREFHVYNSDSALRYAAEAVRIVVQMDPENTTLRAEWMLNKAFIYTVQGLFDEASAILAAIRRMPLSTDLKAEYYHLREYLCSLNSMYLGPNDRMRKQEIEKAVVYRDSLFSLDMGDSPKWLWVPIAQKVDMGRNDVDPVALEKLCRNVDSDTVPSRQLATNAFWLARYYKSVGREDLMLRYMTVGAISDALIENREVAAIQDLSQWLFEHGELTRPYNYLVYALNQTQSYQNRSRTLSIAYVLPAVRDAYEREITQRDRRLGIFLIVLGLLSLGLVASTWFIILELKKLKRSRRELAEVNDMLKKTVADRDLAIEHLGSANASLAAANNQKLGVLAYAFQLTTEYINALEDYRKKLLRNYKAKDMTGLGVLINDPELIREQYQTFYEKFDAMVLSIFPDFVEEYRQSTGDDTGDAGVATKTLNTRMRIHALRRLGVTKSADIARMLNISIRTVYNNKTTPDAK